jgi:hypothetical protein
MTRTANVRKVPAGDAAFGRTSRVGSRSRMAYRFTRTRARRRPGAGCVLRAYRTLRSWREESVFSTWLFALALNLFRSELRRIPQRTVSDEDVGEIVMPGPNIREIDRDRAVRKPWTRPREVREAMIVLLSPVGRRCHGEDSPHSRGHGQGKVARGRGSPTPEVTVTR